MPPPAAPEPAVLDRPPIHDLGSEGRCGARCLRFVPDRDRTGEDPPGPHGRRPSGQRLMLLDPVACARALRTAPDMFIRRFESEGLAHHAYYIADGGEAVVCDPSRDVDRFLDLARERGESIRFALETHRNEDYVIGSTALAAATGARVLHSAQQDFAYGEGVRDGDRFGVGDLDFRVMETPGHTWDSLCFAIAQRSAGDRALAVLSGDTLFAGDTGRTDLLGEREAERLAPALFESLQRLMALGEGVSLLPAHGPGSVCGGNIADRPISTLGFERHANPLLCQQKANFTEAKHGESHVRPPYFRLMEEYNLRGNAPILERLPQPKWVEPIDVQDTLQAGGTVVDLRTPEAFAGGHVPGSYNLWLEGLPAYLGWIAEPREPLTLILPEDASTDRVIRMAVRIGFDRLSISRGGFGAWRDSGRTVGRIGTTDATGFRSRPARDKPVVLDVRKPGERPAHAPDDHLPIFVGELEKRLEEVPEQRPVVTACGVGHRGGLAASILARNGFEHVENLLGGFTALGTR
jgi:hydroxyacylglutathione hydrolase